MSSNKHKRGDMAHTRGGSTKRNPGIFVGRKWVKKANMWCKYENYNTSNKTDKQEFEV